MRPRYSIALVALAAVASGGAYWYWSRPPEPMGERQIAQVAISLSGRWYAAGSIAGRYGVWPSASPDRAQHFLVRDTSPRALAFNADETQLAIAHNGGISVQPVQEMGVTRSIRAGGGFRSVVFDPRRGSLLMVTEGGVIDETDQLEPTPSCCGSVHGIAFSPDGSTMATSGSTPALWDSATGKLIARLEADSEFAPIAFDARRGWVVMGSLNGRVYAWDVKSGAFQGKSPEPAGSVESVAVLKGSPWIVLAKANAPLHMWNPDTGEMRTLEALPSSNVVAGEQPSSVLFGNYAGSVELWNAETGAVISRFTLR